jgi:hypothetical protein
MAEVDPLGFLGREFIAYLADTAETTIDHALVDTRHTEHKKVSAAMAQCHELLAHSAIGIHQQVAAIPDGAEVSAGNLLRQAVGNELPDVASTDDLVQPLAHIARDVFPALLLPVVQDPFFPGGLPSPPHRLLGNAVHEHPAVTDFAARLEHDPLSDLFAVDPPPPFFSFASGIGGAVEPISMPLALLGAACVRARLMDPAFTLDGVVRQLEALIDDLRAAQAGNQITMPVVVALQGLNIQPGSRFELPWGWLRSVDQDTLKAVGDAFLPRGALFIANVSSWVTVGSGSASEGPPMPPTSRIRAFETELETRIQKTTLSLLLLNESPRLSAVPTRTVAVTPFFGTGWGARGYSPEPVPGPQGSLTPDHVGDLLATAALVESRHAPTLAIPARRLISALSARHDIEDGLVDAVVAWESLFAGTEAGELSFRIAAAIAWLLGTDAEERLALHREIAGLYGLRSRILHRGGAGRDVSDERDRAVDVGVRAIKALLEEQPDLVPDENRGKKLIMRGEGPLATP